MSYDENRMSDLIDAGMQEFENMCNYSGSLSDSELESHIDKLEGELKEPQRETETHNEHIQKEWNIKRDLKIFKSDLIYRKQNPEA